MTKPKIVIIDSDICNIFNVKRAFESLDADVYVTNSKKDILDAEKIVLPGVGAFGAGMKSLEKYELTETIKSYAKSGKSLLGICLGMQMLLSQSEEHGVWDGLDIVHGKVKRFKAPESSEAKYKIPQIGWNCIKKNGSNDSWGKTILDSLEEKPYVYFVHSYVVEPSDEKHCLALTNYGQDNFCSVLKKDNVTACQFHPERSGYVGLKILKNFLADD